VRVEEVFALFPESSPLPEIAAKLHELAAALSCGQPGRVLAVAQVLFSSTAADWLMLTSFGRPDRRCLCVIAGLVVCTAGRDAGTAVFWSSL